MRAALACGLAMALCACGHPFLARDGTLVFTQKGSHGASVVTANGVEFHDVVDRPERVVVRDPYEPWRAPLGFLVPRERGHVPEDERAHAGRHAGPRGIAATQ